MGVENFFPYFAKRWGKIQKSAKTHHKRLKLTQQKGKKVRFSVDFTRILESKAFLEQKQPELSRANLRG